MVDMRMTNLASLDLNLFVVLDALLKEVHVGRAGQRVGLSQPATSHALARLRVLFGDQLLVRSGSRMVLTPKASELRGPITHFSETATNVLQVGPFDPSTSQRRFRCMMPDLVYHLLMPPLLQRLQEQAPAIMVESIAWRGPELLTPSALGELDFIVTSLPRKLAGFSREWLYDDHDAIAVRSGHPARLSIATRKGLSSARHVAIVGAGESVDALDAWLFEVGINRNVAAVAPNYLVALGIAASTDLVAIVPNKFAAKFVTALDLELIELPIDPGVDSLEILSPRRSRSDDATTWMRQCMQDVAAGF